MSQEENKDFTPEEGAEMRNLMEKMVSILPVDFLAERLEEALAEFKKDKSEKATKQLKASLIALAIRLDQSEQ